MKVFNIFQDGELVDTVFYTESTTEEEVRNQLIQRGEFDENIEVMEVE